MQKILEQSPHFETYFSATANLGVECSKNNGVRFFDYYLKDCILHQPAIRYESVAVVNSYC